MKKLSNLLRWNGRQRVNLSESSSRRHHRRGRSKLAPLGLIAFFIFALVGAISIFRYGQPKQADFAVHHVGVRNLVTSENLILDLTNVLKKLNNGIKELSLPDAKSKLIFANSVPVTDITADVIGLETFEYLKTKTLQYRLAAKETKSREALKLWAPLLDSIESFRNAKFYFVEGKYADADLTTFDSKIGFEGLARLKSGSWVSLHASQNVTWRCVTTTTDDAPGTWEIVNWEQTKFEAAQRKQLMFRDVLSTALPAEELSKLLKSRHDQYIVRIFKGEPMDLPFPELEPYFDVSASSTHPAVSIVDINNDGWDDFYMMTRWRKNRLFLNQRDGTFRDIAPEMGLDLDRTTCALFADFDNDGDKDVFLGRSDVDSVLLINEDGQFVDRTNERIKEPLPGCVTSVSAADFNNDGLLDLYLCSHVTIGAKVQNVKHAAKFMPMKHAQDLVNWFMQTSPADLWLNRPGPPNRLLENAGGGNFRKSDAIIDVWSNTLQATWSDYDDDGDVDLYLCNDFAPDYLFRNDRDQGFTDITKHAGGDAMRGYGMGASWGDYDNDGKHDLYVSNMYSKAGKRIINQLPTMDPQYMMSANGNRLFKNTDGDVFDLVSGEGPDDQQVTRAGWSWGGQFSDFDNDGFLDIYVSSGFYTAPEEITCNEDL